MNKYFHFELFFNFEVTLLKSLLSYSFICIYFCHLLYSRWCEHSNIHANVEVTRGIWKESDDSRNKKLFKPMVHCHLLTNSINHVFSTTGTHFTLFVSTYMWIKECGKIALFNHYKIFIICTVVIDWNIH